MNQATKSLIGIFVFLVFIGISFVINLPNIPLSYRVAFGSSHITGGSGSGGGGSGGGGISCTATKTKARIDHIRITVHYKDRKTTKQGPNNGNVFENDTTVGSVTWLLPYNAKLSDNERAIAELGPQEISYYLKATKFEFKIPATATITGIVADVERSKEGSGKIQDYSVKIVKKSKITGTEHAYNKPWPTEDEYDAYGSENDLWGVSWTPAEINDEGFGIAVSAINKDKDVCFGKEAVPPPSFISSIEAPPPLPPSALENPFWYVSIKEEFQPQFSNPVLTANEKPLKIESKHLGLNDGCIGKGKENKKDDVIQLQQLLINAGPYLNTSPWSKLTARGTTGCYGPITKEVVTALQKLFAKKQVGDYGKILNRTLPILGYGVWGEATRYAFQEYMIMNFNSAQSITPSSAPSASSSKPISQAPSKQVTQAVSMPTPTATLPKAAAKPPLAQKSTPAKQIAAPSTSPVPQKSQPREGLASTIASFSQTVCRGDTGSLVGSLQKRLREAHLGPQAAQVFITRIYDVRTQTAVLEAQTLLGTSSPSNSGRCWDSQTSAALDRWLAGR